MRTSRFKGIVRFLVVPAMAVGLLTVATPAEAAAPSCQYRTGRQIADPDHLMTRFWVKNTRAWEYNVIVRYNNGKNFYSVYSTRNPMYTRNVKVSSTMAFVYYYTYTNGVQQRVMKCSKR